MDTATAPIAATTSLSILLHGAAVTVLLAVYSQTSSDAAVGRGVEIELVSSVAVAEQHETELPRKSMPEQSQRELVAEIAEDSSQRNADKTVLQVVTAVSADTPYSNKDVASEPVDKTMEEQLEVPQHLSENNSRASLDRATSANQQLHSILELLHSSISDNKEYPYLARRHRREGTTTVAFILHPDGTIENTHLIHSSQTVSLDRAALSAVRMIEPFEAAQEYLDHAEEFQVEVVFNLL